MWYSVSLLFESVHDGQSPAQNLWEERIILLSAASEAAAQQQGEAIGRAEEGSYVSATGEKVHWHFRHIERVFPLDAETLESGTRFSRVSYVLAKFRAY
jgi:hypothetical protein